MGVHIIFSGQGCREYEQRIQGKWSEFIEKIYYKNVKRLDIALDDKSGLVDIGLIEEKIRRAECISQFQKARVLTEYELKSGKTTGKTIYFGAKSSMLQVRIYDKAAEQHMEGHWARIELQARDERAAILALLLFQGFSLSEAIAGTLKYYIRFVEPSKDSNKSRWKESAWWQETIGCVEKLRLTTERPKASIKRSEEWIKNQVSPTLATVMKHKGGDWEYLLRLIDYGSAKMKARHHNLLQNLDE